MIISYWKSSFDSNQSIVSFGELRAKTVRMPRVQHKNLRALDKLATLQALALRELLTKPKGLQLLGSNLQPISSTLEPFGYNEMISMDDGSVNQQKVEFEL